MVVSGVLLNVAVFSVSFCFVMVVSYLVTCCAKRLFVVLFGVLVVVVLVFCCV